MQVGLVGPDNTVSLRSVQVGERVGSLWIIERGLQPGERIIVEGLEKVKAGERVAPIAVEAEPAGDGVPRAAAPVAPSPPPAASADRPPAK